MGVVKSFSVAADSSGQFVVDFAAGSAENPKVNGIVVSKDPIPVNGGGGGGGTPGGGGGGGTPGGGGGGGTNNYGWTNCKGYVGITFDDGPTNQYTQTLVNTLKQNNLIPVTFFNEGQNVATASSMVKVEMQVGAVNNHSYTHSHMMTMSQSTVLDELTRTNTAIQNAGAPKPTLIRWPYGEHNSTDDAAASQAGLYSMTWDVDSGDWNSAATSAIISANNQLQNGQVILMHEWPPNTISALPTITSNLKSRGMCPGKIVNGKAVAP
jgi:peptidoglycan/xylan/chitin deacetylase (PgdA/CDA1 family)